jgi:twitching motility protein PilT
VLSTLHTSSAAKTADRVIDIFPADSRDQVKTMFAESILAIIAQALLPRKDGKGRVAALEILVANPAIRNLIREGKNFMIPSVIQTNQQLGMQTLDHVLRELLNKGIITKDEALRKALDPKAFGGVPDNLQVRKGI